MKLELPDHQNRYVQQKLQSGAYRSLSHIVEASLELLIQQDEHRRLIGEGLEDLENGRTISGETVFASLRERFV